MRFSVKRMTLMRFIKSNINLEWLMYPRRQIELTLKPYYILVCGVTLIVHVFKFGLIFRSKGFVQRHCMWFFSCCVRVE